LKSFRNTADSFQKKVPDPCAEQVGNETGGGNDRVVVAKKKDSAPPEERDQSGAQIGDGVVG